MFFFRLLISFFFLFFTSNVLAYATIGEAFSACNSLTTVQVRADYNCVDFPDISTVGYTKGDNPGRNGSWSYEQGCEAPLVVDNSSGGCAPPPPPPPPPPKNCDDEPPSDFNFESPKGPNGEMLLCIGECTMVVYFKGCAYTVNYGSGGDDDDDDCRMYVDANGNHRMSCTTESNGDNDPNDPNGDGDSGDGDGSGEDPSSPNASENDEQTPLAQDMPPDTCTDINGLNFCDAPDPKCYSINGQETCLANEPNCGTVSGKRVCANDPKNCGELNGKYVCIEKQVPTIDTTCMQNPTSTACLNLAGKEGVRTSSSTTVSTNQDGSTTRTTTIDNNIIGQDSSVKTVTTHPDGSTSVNTSGQGGYDQQNVDANKEGNGLLEEISSGVKEGNDYGSSDLGDQMGAEFGNVVGELADSVSAFQDPFSSTSYRNISDWLPSLPTSSCSGSINTSIFGRSFVLDPCVKLQPLRDILGWVFSILAMLSVIRTAFSISGEY